MGRKKFELRKAFGVVELHTPDGHAEPVGILAASLLRSHPDVDDRTQPAYDVPVGTAGTATVRGVEGVRVIRSTEDDWFTAARVSGMWVHPDREVTDFVPDRIVDDALIKKLRDIITGTAPASYAGLLADEVELVLRGKS